MNHRVSTVSRQLLASATLASLVFTLSACSTVKKADFAEETTLVEGLAQVDNAIHEALGRQMDVIAPEQVESAIEHRNEAREEFAEGDDPEEVWDELRYAKGHLLRAQELYDQRHGRIPAVLKARSEALQAGALRYSYPSKELAALDDSFRAVARELDKDELIDERWARLADRYRALQIMTVQARYLGEAEQIIAEARQRGARIFAPRTLEEARDALEVARTAIMQSPENKPAFSDEVLAAYGAARILAAVNATSRDAAGSSNETVARAIVKRDLRMSSLREELAATETESLLKSMALVETQAQLNESAVETKSEDSLTRAKRELAGDDAEVFQQGDRLLIRLKSLNFPGDKDVLSKVSGVANDVDAQRVVVQGPKAESIAEYLEREIDGAEVQAVQGASGADVEVFLE